MSEDRLEFNGLGTVEVEFDDQVYRLTRPKMGQWRYFQRKLREMSQNVQDELTALTEAVEKAKTPAAQKKAEDRLQKFAEIPFYTHTIAWMKEVFDQLGSQPLPASDDDWPAWLAADTSLPSQIVNHWKTSPLVSGSTVR